MPSYSAGLSFLQAFAREGYSRFNLRVSTIFDLAMEVCKQSLHQKGIELCSDNEYIVYGILMSLSKQDKLQYFKGLQITPTLSGAVFGAISELKHAGILPEDLSPDKFVDPKKGEDFTLIYARYEEILKKTNKIDACDLVTLATCMIQNDYPFKGQVLIIPSNLRLSRKETEFVHAIMVHPTTLNNVEILRLQKPFGLEEPAGRIKSAYVIEANKNESGKANGANTPQIDESVSPLAWLYDVDGYSGNNKVDIEIISAYGENNEAREVIRHIGAQGTGFDDVAVFYTSREPYSQFFYDISREYDIPITFGGGIMLFNSIPGKVAFGLLKFIESNFSVAELIPLLNSNSLIPDTKLFGFQVVRCLRQAAIGWGRDRYSLQLGKLLEQCDQPENETDRLYEDDHIPEDSQIHGVGRSKNDHASEQSHPQKAGYSSEGCHSPENGHSLEAGHSFYVCRTPKVGHSSEGGLENSYAVVIRETMDFISSFLSLFPDVTADNCLPLDLLANGLAEAVSRYSNVTSEVDAEAREKIVQELQVIADSINTCLPLDEAIKIIEDILGNIRIQRSRPCPGHIHIDSFSNGVWINRKRTYIVGLNSDRFPGSAKEDAILLDVERAAISPDLKLGRNRGKEKTSMLAELMASLKGPVVLSYPSFNTVENKDQFPASILLQAFRLQSGDPRKDYSALCSFINAASGFVPMAEEALLDENEWWLRLCVAQYRHSLSPILRAYPWLRRGEWAWRHRLSTYFSEYDGKIPADRDLLDPRLNREKVLSPSQLETLAKCPFSYFLKCILRVKPLEELVYDPGVWLDAAQRGSLLHKVFELYFNAIVKRDERPSYAGHKQFLFELADEAIQQMKLVIPPPNEAVYEFERRELLESCNVFLRSEEEHAQDGVPVWFEYRFGWGAPENAGQEEPVFVEYKTGCGFYLRGSIDRVDKIAPNTFRVLDYKTGSTYSYRVKEPFKGGRQLQYALYAVALEAMLRKTGHYSGAVVNEGGYIFPSIKGEGQRIIRRPIDRQALADILDSLFELMANGCFNMSDTNDDCKFCDYSPVCCRSFLEVSLGKKLQDPDIVHFWGVRQFA